MNKIILIIFLIIFGNSNCKEKDFVFKENIRFYDENEIIKGEKAIYSRNPGTKKNFWGTYINGDNFVGELKSNQHTIQYDYLMLSVTGGKFNKGNYVLLKIFNDNELIDEIFYDGLDPNEDIEYWFVKVDKYIDKNFQIYLKDSVTESRGWIGVGNTIVQTNHYWLYNIYKKLNYNFFFYTLLAIIYFFIFLFSGIIPFYFFEGQSLKNHSSSFLLKLLIFSFLVSYLFFWIYFINNFYGKYLVYTFTLINIFFIAYKREYFLNFISNKNVHSSLLLLSSVSIFYLALNFLHNGSNSLFVSNERYTWMLPIDNHIPLFFSECVYFNNSSISECFNDKMGGGIWLSSDRPPLFSAVILFLLPFNLIDNEYFYQFVGTIIQSTWILGILSLNSEFRFTKIQKIFFITSLIFSGFSIINSVYLWPKMVTIGLYVFGLILIFKLPNLTKKNLFYLATSWALATLMHGGIQISIIATLAVLMFPLTMPKLKQYLTISIIFITIIFPWNLYKKFYDPPGNHLEVMRIAGQKDKYLKDNIYPGQLKLKEGQSTFLAIYDSYTNVPLRVIFENKIENLKTPFSKFSDYFLMLNKIIKGELNAYDIRNFRQKSFFITVLAIGPSLIFLLLLINYKSIQSFQSLNFMTTKKLKIVFILTLSYILWVILMFEPGATVIHQGSYANIPLIFLILTFGAKYIKNYLVLIILFSNIIWTYLIWLIPVENYNYYIFPSLFAILSFLGIIYSTLLYSGQLYKKN